MLYFEDKRIFTTTNLNFTYKNFSLKYDCSKLSFIVAPFWDIPQKFPLLILLMSHIASQQWVQLLTSLAMAQFGLSIKPITFQSQADALRVSFNCLSYK